MFQRKIGAGQNNGLMMTLAVSIFFGLLTIPVTSIMIKTSESMFVYAISAATTCPYEPCPSFALTIGSLVEEITQILWVLLPIVFGSLLGYKYKKAKDLDVGNGEMLLSTLIFMVIFSLPSFIAYGITWVGIMFFPLLYAEALAGWILGRWAGSYLKEST